MSSLNIENLEKIDIQTLIDDPQLYKSLKEDLVTGFNGSNKIEVFLICAYLPRWHFFAQIRYNAKNDNLYLLLNILIDYSFVAFPIILTNALPDYILSIYGISFLVIGVLIGISEVDSKGKIMINIFKYPNPRLAYTKFENRKLSDLMLESKND
ncbi:UNKNOWN [Stylonychia lemnae]|uniref:Uncharacterized protein n=1 Tax=Stylonychia lemnae TaxID=5949 RepID=A0A078B357_STYLE|nr:UNKNOWN [Stylonychia lemnae]|eukprot:CDW87682.1 UNKNOWN [Stylonychia lemnae]